ncbi:MAG TPA: adenylate kinase [Candidatus Omnitrophica bacterium]|nr:adenylate kinase [Candidatus Omnitrophota bacterium]
MRIVLFGAPGSGKGTQAQLLSEHLNIKRISLGDLLREEVKNDTELGKKVREYMEKGLLVSDDIVVSVIEKNIDDEGFIVDGFPRNINQAFLLEEILKKKNNELDVFIYLDVDENTIVERLSKRRVCKKCGALYHLVNLPPKIDGRCDLCGGDLIQREDDRPQLIKKRWEVFEEESSKLIGFYSQRDKLIRIDARGKKEEVFNQIKEKLLCHKN